MITKEQIAKYPTDVRFDLVGAFPNNYFYKGTNTPAHNIKGDMEYPNIYEKIVDEDYKDADGNIIKKGTKKIYRYLSGCSSIDYDWQIAHKYPSIEETKKQLRSTEDTLYFSKRFILVNRLADPTKFDFLINSPDETTNAKKLNKTPLFQVILPEERAKKQLTDFELHDRAVEIIKRIYADTDKTLFTQVCAFFNIDSNAEPNEKLVLLREKAAAAPDVIIKAIKSIEGGNDELVQFGLDMGLIMQTNTGFSKANGDSIKKYNMADKLDASQLRTKFSKWLSTEDGETHKQWLRQEMSAKAKEKTESLMVN